MRAARRCDTVKVLSASLRGSFRDLCSLRVGALFRSNPLYTHFSIMYSKYGDLTGRYRPMVRVIRLYVTADKGPKGPQHDTTIMQFRLY